MEAPIPTWQEMVGTLEFMDSDERKGMFSLGFTERELSDRFPEIAAVEVFAFAIDAPIGDIPARSYRVPSDRARAGLVWVHGGAFVGGDLDMPEANWVALMIAARGIPVLSLDYRKCLHGTRYPAPSDDVLAGWQWAVKNSNRLGTSGPDLHLGGASAGANLVAGVAKRLRDGAGQMPRSVILVYPLVHKELPRASSELSTILAAKPSWFTAESVLEINLHYAGSADTLHDPYAFAANGDVSGLPPHLILNSEADPLRASGEAYAEKIESAGGIVCVDYERGTQHGHLNQPGALEGTRSIERIVRWIEDPCVN